MYEDATLLDALRTLKKGHHMALLVRRPGCTPVGIITIEDLIEECVQEENPLMEEFSAISPSSTLTATAP
ncbi:hypothetical protein PRIPAC_85252 [Pristionchus pacificus]|uniref:CBS domain-containing protein n=1 Tax=Pristionchus pacificus TaxID=54126 RepID=A0A2A6BMS5_PRIPA|nr:hypothetical protein PRIPAC_85252 [Pristionchus pacificus]|eukprot:PDM67217.1 hypothetical protein PRIPAC_48634 [Pristionchus pacificus]